MPAIPAPSLVSLYAARAGALPARFRRQRLLIVGCGDIGLRVAAIAAPRQHVLALSSSPARVPLLRKRGITPLLGNLDQPASLRRLGGLAHQVLHLAPPNAQGTDWQRDTRTQALLAALRSRGAPPGLLYASTSGVYGDAQGQWVGETWPAAPGTPRAARRVDAERRARHFGRSAAVRSAILRVPGIYAPNRAGATPRERLLKGLPVLQRQDDVYTNHIHADDLARACYLALWRAAPQRCYNVCDDSQLLMGDYYDLAADLYGLPRPPRVSRASAPQSLPLSLLSFMNESRRLLNQRMKRELRLVLRFATVSQGLRER